MKQLFLERSNPRNQAVVLFIVSLLLFVIDGKSDALDRVRQSTGLVLEPVYWLSTAPSRLIAGVSDIFESRDVQRATLRERNQQIRLLQAGQLKMSALEAENARLRSLLGSASRMNESVLIAEIKGLSPDPSAHHITLDKGRDDGVFVGQPVIDAAGLVGQVVEASSRLSKVLLVTDQNHAVPVLAVRTAAQLIAEGRGQRDMLSLRHVSASLDLKVGDLLVTSGLGQRFPSGYPVGLIQSYHLPPGAAFAQVLVKPTSRLQTLDHVLLVFDEGLPAERSDPDRTTTDG
ncbi:MAG: rod shape-determining protein MreC [Pseudomonadales bacterium]